MKSWKSSANNLTSVSKLPGIPNYFFMCTKKRSGPNIEPWDSQEHCTNKKPEKNQTVSHMGNLTNYFYTYASNKFSSFPKGLFQEKYTQWVDWGYLISRDCEMKACGISRDYSKKEWSFLRLKLSKVHKFPVAKWKT